MRRYKRVTIHDVAQRAGVSRSTVSRVINNSESVNPHIKERVVAAISEMGYKPDRRTGRRGDIRTVGLLMANIRNPFFTEMISGIERVAKIHDYHLVVCDAEENPDIESTNIGRLVKLGVAGIILVACRDSNPAFNRIPEQGIALVCLDRRARVRDLCLVESDNEEGAYQATRYLLNLDHREIAFVAGPEHQSTIQQRLKGYKRALSEYGILPVDDIILSCDGFYETAYTEFRGFLKRDIPFSAVFAANDLMAFGVKRALDEVGLSVPRDVALIGYDDILFSSSISLTTIAQPMYEMGRNAMILLMDLINDRVRPPQKIVLPSRMVIRGSCKEGFAPAGRPASAKP